MGGLAGKPTMHAPDPPPACGSRPPGPAQPPARPAPHVREEDEALLPAALTQLARHLDGAREVLAKVAADHHAVQAVLALRLALLARVEPHVQVAAKQKVDRLYVVLRLPGPAGGWEGQQQGPAKGPGKGREACGSGHQALVGPSVHADVRKDI